jgi:hypothetical protein
MKLRYSLLLVLIALGLATSCADKKTESADSCEVMIDQQDYDGVINSSSCSRYYKASAYLGKSGFMLKTTDSPTVKSLPASSTGSSTPDTAGYSILTLVGISADDSSRLTKIQAAKSNANSAIAELSSGGALTGDEKFIDLFAKLTSFQLDQIEIYDTGKFTGSCTLSSDHAYDGQLFENERTCATITCSNVSDQITGITGLLDSIGTFTKSDTTAAVCGILDSSCVLLKAGELASQPGCSSALSNSCVLSGSVYKSNRSECN